MLDQPLVTLDPRSVPVRWSRLKQMALSPAHYYHALTHDRAPTPAMLFGTLVHRLLLGGDEVVVWEADRRGKEWLAFRDLNAGRTIVTASEYARAMACVQALKEHPIASNFLVGNYELEVRWKLGGRDCLGHVDAAGWNWVSELKTSQCAAPEWFRRHSLAMGYHAQLAWYADALESIGRKIETAHIAVVEAQPPHQVTTFRLTPRCLEEGRKLNRLWWERLMVCESANVWPGYVQTEVPLDAGDGGVSITLPGGEEIAA